ncbi:MAG: hypothetical protein PHS97_03555 [Oscillospiraceae bacterium]|nr:hypothetical protein [Oscillospiraceae bacterium]
MKELVSLLKRNQFVFSMLLILSGIACIAFTDHIHMLLPYFLGVLLVLGGGELALRGLLRRIPRAAERAASGIVYLIVGVVILTHGATANAMIGAAWGMIGLLEGAESLRGFFRQVFARRPFLTPLLRAAVEITLAIWLLLDPAAKLPHHIALLGVEQIFIALHILLRRTAP